MDQEESYQYPAAHLGHLDEGQQAALDKFKVICQEKGYYFPKGQDGREVASHDDETLLRYLRARKFVPEEGFQQFKDTEEWRKENHIDEYYEVIDINDYEAARKLYPQWTGRRDRRGIPVYVYKIVELDSKRISAYQSSLTPDKSPPINKDSKIPPRMMRLFALYENLTRFVLPLCSAVENRPHPETPVSQSNNIVDITGVGLRQFWNLKTHMQDASTLATANYPETLDRIFIIGAPSFFPTVWSWIKRWFDPITVSKIFILSAQDAKATLEKYIDPENIPSQYGGSLKWEWGSLPSLEPEIQKVISWEKPLESFPIGPIRWSLASNGKLEAIAVGKDNGTVRHDVVATVDSDISHIHGISRPNTTIDWSKENVLTTVGSYTQPAEGDPDFGKNLNSDTPTPVTSVDNLTSNMAATNISQAFDESKSPTAQQPLQPSEVAPRSGTSSTAYAAQKGTHAEGQMKEETPQMVDYGHGDKAAVMETSTVGQARKDPQVAKDAPPASMLDQAKNAVASVTTSANAAVGGVLGAVGLGGAENKYVDATKVPEPKPEEQKPSINVKDSTIEDFIRDQNTTTATTKK